MRRIHLLILFLFFRTIPSIHAQIENVFVETYYISDANDATDTTGGGLPVGSVTYRIFVDLPAGSSLIKIYGDANHPLKFESTEHFFNNKEDGQTFAKEFSKVRYGENTVALDSWLTLGQTTRAAAKTYFGIPKEDDGNGSFIGGQNNDGGSAMISNGLLANEAPDAGIPLTVADGMDTMAVIPSNWADYGIVDDFSGVDSSIFGSANKCSRFISYNAGLQNSGVMGVDRNSNMVLIAQLTTTGTISFEINLEVKNSNGVVIRYVANDSVLLEGEVLSRNLKYPFDEVCGCPDPHYLEYRHDRDCDALDSCHTAIVFGCMDTLACNYNAGANFNIPSLCCYPGYCNDRDVAVVCPELNYKLHGPLQFNLFPNPVADKLTFQAPSCNDCLLFLLISDLLGKSILEVTLQESTGAVQQDLNVSSLSPGLYFFTVISGQKTAHVPFIKK